MDRPRRPRLALPGWRCCSGFIGVLGFSFSLPATRLAVEELDATFVGLGRAVVAAALERRAAACVLRRARPRARAARPAGARGSGSGGRLPAVHRARPRELSSAHGAVIAGLLPAATASWPWCAPGAPRARLLGWPAARAWPRCSCSPPPRAPAVLRLATFYVLCAVALGALGYAEGGALARELGGCADDLLGAGAVDAGRRAVRGGGRGHRRTCPGGAVAWLGFAYVSLVSMFLGFFAWYAGLAAGGVAKIGRPAGPAVSDPHGRPLCSGRRWARPRSLRRWPRCQRGGD